MDNESFSDRNRRRREAATFRNLYAYAQNAGISDPKKSAEIEARRLHGDPQENSDGVSRPRRGNGRSSRSAGAGRASVPRNLEDRTKEQLYARAQELDVEGRSQMTKDELVAAIRAKQ